MIWLFGLESEHNAHQVPCLCVPLKYLFVECKIVPQLIHHSLGHLDEFLSIGSTTIQLDLTSDAYCCAALCFLSIRKKESSKKVAIQLKFLQLFFWQYVKITILNKVSKYVYELIHSQVPQLTCFGIEQ